MTSQRPSVSGTARALTAGTVLSAALLALGFVCGLARLASIANLLSTAGVVALLTTPAVGLLLTFIELRPGHPRAAMLALVVLGVLGVATALALLAR